MRLVVLIISLVISFASSSEVFAQSNVKTYKFENDITMNGVISSTNKYFEVAKNAQAEGAKLNLVFTKSELLDVDYSTITILVNDVAIHSQRLSGNKEYKKEVSIDIPIDLVKSGFNKVEIKAYKTISDMVCRDDSNTANWLVIHKESNINLLYKYRPQSNLVSEFKNTYIRTNENNKLETTLVIPDNYSSGELSSAMLIGGKLRSASDYKDVHFDFDLYSNIKNKNNNIIYIGKASNTKPEIINLLNDSEKSEIKSNCIIKTVNSVFDKNKKMLIIISENENLLKKATKLIISDKLINELNKESIVINEDTDVDDIDKYAIKDTISLKELGYDNLILKGPFTQESIINIEIPKSKKLSQGTKIHLNMRYAENLDFERSLVTVYLNNVPIGSKKLSKEKANNDTLELNFPKEVLNQSKYQMKIVFNLELLDLMCVTRDTDNPFAYVSSDSYIGFDYNENENLSMKSYPYPFINDKKYNNTVIVVPDKLDSTQLTQIANMISYIGEGVKYNNGNLEFIKINDLNSKHKENNMIIIGTPNNNKLIKEINNKLNVKFNNNYSEFESNENIKFIGDYSKQLASIQFLKSPFDKSKSIMVLASTNMANLSYGTKYLSNPKLVNSLNGDAILINKDGNVDDLNYNIQKEKEKKQETKKGIKLGQDSKIFILISLAILAMVITCTVLLSLKYKK